MAKSAPISSTKRRPKGYVWCCRMSTTPVKLVHSAGIGINHAAESISAGSVVSADIAMWSVKSISSQLIPPANQANYLRQPW
jgi:hypothetical protein